MRARILSSLTVLPFIGVGCSTPDDGVSSGNASGVAAATAADAGDARQAIDAAMARYIGAVTRGDTAVIAASLTDDPVIVLPSGPALKGKSEVTRMFAGMFVTSPVKALEPTRADLKVTGDVAVETGTFEVRMQPAGGKQMIDKGQYMIVWQRQPDGSWKMARGFNRSDAPPSR